ncbi:hypothetical protein CYMTET_49560, partial [Cymbomonas tetramitiformis]
VDLRDDVWTQLHNCTLEYQAVLPEYNSRDAGRRKYLGDYCQVSREENALGCWWAWERGRFEGEGCEWAPSLECLCTHLTDFMAQTIETGEVHRGPGKASIISLGDMTSLTPADLEDSDKLISIVVSLIGGGLAFWLLSQALLRHGMIFSYPLPIHAIAPFCRNHQLHLLRWLLQAKRDSIYFLEVTLQGSLGKGKTLLTWSIKDGGEYFGQYRSFADEARLTERVKLRKLRNSTSTSRFNQGMNDIVLGPDHHDLLGTPRTIQMEEEGPSSTNRSQPTKVEDVTIVDTCMSRKGITCRMRSPSAMLLTKTPAKYRPGVTMPIGMMEFDMESMGDHQSEAGREDIKLDDALKSPKSTSSEHQLADSGNVGLSSMVALLLSSEAEQQWHEVAREQQQQQRARLGPPRRARHKGRHLPMRREAAGEKLNAAVDIEAVGGARLGSHSALPPLGPRPVTESKESATWSPRFDLSNVFSTPRRATPRLSGREAATSAATAPPHGLGGFTGRCHRVVVRVKEWVWPPLPGMLLCDHLGLNILLYNCASPITGQALTSSRASGSKRRAPVRSLTCALEEEEGSKPPSRRTRKSRRYQPTSAQGSQAILVDGMAAEEAMEEEEESKPPSRRTRKSRRYQPTSAQGSQAILVDGMAAEEAMEEEEESKPPSRRTRKSRRYQPTSAQGSQAILVDGMAAEEAVEEKEERRRRSSVKVLGNKLLSFDRMLGTAVMHAFLSNTNLYSHQELREQAMLQEMVPWTMPIGRNFSWYVQVLMVALVQVKTSGWLRRSHLLQLVFLQAVDGHVPMTQSLANLMRVGEPEQPLLIKPAGIFPLAVRPPRRQPPASLYAAPLLCRSRFLVAPPDSARIDTSLQTAKLVGSMSLFLAPRSHSWRALSGALLSQTFGEGDWGTGDVQAFQKSVPKELETILDSHAVRWSAEAVWATACAIALYDQELMADWIVNPAEKPRALQRTLGEHAQHWLDRIVQDDPALRDCIAETQDQATRFVQASLYSAANAISDAAESASLHSFGCIEQHWKRVSEFQQATLARSAPVPWWQRWPRNVRKEIRGLFWIYVSSHPLLALWATPVSAPLSRAEAITLQDTKHLQTAGAGERKVNNVLMMLSVVTWFEYSRAITCCEELKEHLGCEPASDSAAACIGFATCGALYDAAADMAPLPQELGTWAPSQCLAFPQNTLIGKMYATALVVAILLPVNATLQALFKVTTTTPVLSFWSSSPRSKKKSSALLGPLGSMLLHATMTMLYALLDNFERFTKAMALIIAGVAMLLLKPADKIVSVIFAVASTMRLIKRRLVKAIITGDRQRRQQEHADHLAQLIVAPFVNGHIETFTYGFILIFWGTLMWILLAFLTVLRGTMGREWEQELLVGWAMGLLMEHFGLVSLRLVGFKMLAVFFVGKVHAQLSNHLEIANWYESKVEEDVQLLRMEAHERRAQGK